MDLAYGSSSGEEAVGVRPALPVDIILGNDLAGDRVWADAPSPSVVTQVPVSLLAQPDGGEYRGF